VTLPHEAAQRVNRTTICRCQPQAVMACAGESAERLRRALAPHIIRRIAGFQMRLVGQTVVLDGTAPSFYSKQLVQQEVMSATDRQVLNRIDVPTQS
jgi:hypothetical protein